MARSTVRRLWLGFGLAICTGFGLSTRPFRAPFAGVAVSPAGFVALLASSQPPKQRLFPVVISTLDKARVVSAEAHTILQLMQGIDTGTAVLPPNALQRLFSPDDASAVELRRVMVNPLASTPSSEAVREDSGGPCPLAIALERAPALSKAFARLGVALTDEESVQLLRRFADSRGELTRYNFSLALEAARRAELPPKTVATTLLATDGRKVDVPAFAALALALRYQVELVVDNRLFDVESAVDAADADSAFPLLRRVEDIQLEGTVLAAHSKRMFDEAARRVADSDSRASKIDT